jgi:hypothetical protein
MSVVWKTQVSAPAFAPPEQKQKKLSLLATQRGGPSVLLKILHRATRI